MRGLIRAAAAVAICAAPAAAQPADPWASAEGLEAARAEAPIVLVAFITLARQPRGAYGLCPADARIVAVERGRALAFGAPLGVRVPCAASPRSDLGTRPARRVPMAFMRDRTWARVYLDVAGRLIDYQPLRLEPARPPRHWREGE